MTIATSLTLIASRPEPAEPRFSTEPRVERVTARALLALAEEVEALDAMALEDNAFAGADAILAACRHLPAHLAPAFLTVRSGTRLIGLMAVRQQADRAFSLLRGWEHPLLPYGVTLLDRDHADVALAAVLASLDRLGLARNGLCLPRVQTGGALSAKLQSAAARRGGRVDFLSAHPRAVLNSGEHARWSKERRRQKRRLADGGTLQFDVLTAPGEVRSGLERFLALEAAGWKGRVGTALLSDAAEANLARSLVWSALRHQRALILQMTRGDEVVAAAVALVHGGHCYIWKIAHDEALAHFSPGALLLLQFSDWAAANQRFAVIDSCAHAGATVVEAIWTSRVTVGDAVLQLTGDRPAFEATVARERMRRSLRERVKTIYRRLRPTRAA